MGGATDQFTSDVTFAEVRFGIEQMTDPVRRADLVHWLDRTMRPLFAGRVLPVTEDALLRWRLMLEAGRKIGHTFSEPDLLIAALAALANLIVVMRRTAMSSSMRRRRSLMGFSLIGVVLVLRLSVARGNPSILKTGPSHHVTARTVPSSWPRTVPQRAGA